MSALHRLRQRAREVAAHPDEEVPSPCLSVCRMDEAVEFCVGCRRTLDEIAAWPRMDEAGKRQVWQLIAQRAKEQT